ncbi:MAG: hypothetical protein JXR94_10590, partial [Candidatus Hydrogenedentes bacterium]|nr:hypothetical protein [Candidatus Hydrogenedentota bacterium]
MRSRLYTAALLGVALCAMSSCRAKTGDGVTPGADTPLPQFAPGEQFRLEEQDGRWWFVSPEGEPFLSFGVNHITSRGDTIKGTD